MLRFAVLLICFAGALAKLDASSAATEVQNRIANQHKQCMAKTGADEELIQQANKGEFADDRKLECYAKCVLVVAGLMDDKSGKLNYTAMQSYFPGEVSEILTGTFSSCNARTSKTDLCERAYDLFKCYYSTNPKLYFFP